jgi:anaerobic magnesium-protoporphyrin IX monomethyl ester cyclase
MAIRRITCIHFDGEFPDFCYRLVMPDYGLPVIGTILSQAGYDVRVFVEHVQAPTWTDVAGSDLVCFSCLNAGADKVHRLAREIRERLGIPTVLGGTHATYFPEASLEHCDYAVLGEGDETIVDLVRTLDAGGDVSKVAGIAYRVGDRVHRTPPRPGPARFDVIPNYDLVAGFHRVGLWEGLRRRQAQIVTIQSSRGCPYHCTFCIVNTMFPTGYRKRSIDAVIADMRDKRRYGRHLLFVDNEFSMQRAHTKALLRRMIAERFDFDIVVFARIEIVKDDELLALMRQAGITYIYQGYESIQPETLSAYDKRQTFDDIVAAIQKLQGYGFGLLGSFVVGADTDTAESIRGTVQFAVDHKLANAYLWPIWGHFPEQQTGYTTITPWWRSIFRGWAYCDGHYVTHFPKRMRPSALQRAIIEGYRTIYSPRQVLSALRRGKLTDARWRLAHRYLWADIEPGPRAYMSFLEEIEDGLYDGDGLLREAALIERVRKDPRWTFQAGNRAVRTLGLSPLELPVSETNNVTCVPPRLDSVRG